MPELRDISFTSSKVITLTLLHRLAVIIGQAKIRSIAYRLSDLSKLKNKSGIDRI